MNFFQRIDNKALTGFANASMNAGIQCEYIDFKKPGYVEKLAKNDILFVSNPNELNWQVAEKPGIRVYFLDCAIPKFGANNSNFHTVGTTNLADTLRFPKILMDSPPFKNELVTYIDTETKIDEKHQVVSFGKFAESYGYIGRVDSANVIGLCEGARYLALTQFLVPELCYHFDGPVIIDEQGAQLDTSNKPKTYSEALQEIILG